MAWVGRLADAGTASSDPIHAFASYSQAPGVEDSRLLVRSLIVHPALVAKCELTEHSVAASAAPALAAASTSSDEADGSYSTLQSCM